MTMQRVAASMALATMLLFGITACNGGAEEETAGECMDDKEFFQKEVWSSFMGSECTSCHTAGGQAKDTDLVLQPETQTGFIEANMSIVRNVAELEKDGKSLILIKPTGGLEHDGGVVLEQGSPRYEALAEMVRRFDEPVTCGDAGTTVEEQVDRLVLMSPEETLRKGSLNLAGRLPTRAQQFRVSTGGEEALDDELDRIMSEEAFYERVEEMFNDMFLVERYLGRDNAIDLLDQDYYPNARWFEEDEDNPRDLSMENQEFLEAARMYTNNSVAREPLELASWLVRNDRPFHEIVTADYMLVNPYTARVYGAEDVEFEDPMDPNEWTPADIPGQPHAGVLTSPMWLNRFPTTPTNRNRHRSRMVYSFFLATDVMKLAERPIDPTSISDHNPTVNNPNCNVCHKVIDPVAGLLQNWNQEGSYAPPEDGWYPEMWKPGYGDRDYDHEKRFEAVRFLADNIKNDPRFALSMVHHMYRGITGQEPLSFPSDSSAPDYTERLLQYEMQDRIFDEIADKFVASDFNLKVVIKEIVKSPYFRAKGAAVAEEEEVAKVDEVGSSRMLTPELLADKIEATTGQRWVDRNGVDFLLQDDEYLILYGGIDSDDVIERITEPNGIMVGIQFRMANEMACRTTALDFTRPQERRRYFPYVEPGFVPFDASGFEVPEAKASIKKNIQYLHWHFLGERLEIDSEEVNRTYDLWVNTLKEGQQKLDAEELNANLRCDAEEDALGNELPEEQRVNEDPDYTIRAWMAVITYLMSDYRFVYE